MFHFTGDVYFHIFNSSINLNRVLDIIDSWAQEADETTIKEMNRLYLHAALYEYAVWDYSQWSIGYGTGVPEGQYPNGISREEAEVLLREYLDYFEKCLNKFIVDYNVSLNQNQFDALMSFIYNLGPNVLNYEKMKLRDMIVSGDYTDEELIAEFKTLYPGRVCDINGARVEFDDGWGLVRASSNLPCLVLIFEAKTAKRIKEIRKIFKDVLDKYKEISQEWETDI